jgi:hypothetical protein
MANDPCESVLLKAGISLERLVPERKLGFFVKIKENENFNHRNTDSISRIKI